MSKGFEPAYTAFATESLREGSLGVVKLADTLGGAKLVSVEVLLLVPKCPKFKEFEVTQVVLFDSHIADTELLAVVQFRLVLLIVMAGVARGILVMQLIL
jgi:hypothetical protein